MLLATALVVLGALNAHAQRIPRYYTYEGSPVGPASILQYFTANAGQVVNYNKTGDILFYNDDVMDGTVDVNIIYYGASNAAFAQTARRDTLKAFLGGVSSTAWFSSAKGYNGKNTGFVQGVRTAKEIFLDCGNPCEVPTTATTSIITKLFENNQLDRNLWKSSIYLLVFGPEVTVRTGIYNEYILGKDFCSYHSWFRWVMTGRDYKFMVTQVPDFSKSKTCALPINQSVSPNGDVSIDNTITYLAHELVETLVSPRCTHPATWKDANNIELMDKCEQYITELQTLSSGAQYNLDMGARKFVVTPVHNRNKQACSMNG